MKRFLGKLVLAVSFIIFYPHVSHAYFPGFNAGVQVGGVQLGGKHVLLDHIGKNGTGKPVSRSYMAGAYGGYIIELGQGAFRILLGVEGFFNKCGAQASTNIMPDGGPAEGKLTVKQLDAKGGSLIIGALVNPKVAIYGRVGVETSRFQLNYQDLVFAQTNKTAVYKKNYAAVVPGIGGALLLGQKVYISLDYSFPIYKKLVVRSNTDLVDGTRVNMTYRPIEHRILFRLGFRIGG